MYHYPIIQLSESTPIHLTCPDFKNLSIIVTTAQEAHAAALEGLITALTACVRQRSKIPPPSNVSDPLFIVRLPLTTMAKIMLWNTLCEEGVSRAELARR
ncbi:hypothetical protein, partial [Mesorhizobium japonicum]|uniref:hypothetical protein n=1 Tax=Mesorhizobium japonicum TaxID=2066070 RepID=UPI003B5AD540